VASARAFVDSFLVSLASPAAAADRSRLDSAGFVWARGATLLDADSLARLIAAQRAAGKSLVLGTNDVQVTPLGPDVVAWSGIVSGVAKDSSGQRSVRGALTLVLRSYGGAWHIVVGHESVRAFDDVHEAAAGAPH
jgi:hypothetical protein